MQKPGERHVRQHQLSWDMRMVQSDYWPIHALSESAQPSHNQPLLVLTFGQLGNSRYRECNGREIAFSAGHLTVTSFQASDGERLYRAGERVQQLRLILSAASVRHYFGEQDAEGLLQPQLKRHLFSRFGQATVAQLNQTQDDPLLREIQALSLLALHRHQIQPSVLLPKLHPQMIERLEHARGWMHDHLNETFSLGTLALAAGLSDYQLKTGFQQHFHCTPGAMLLQMRMEHAHHLLEQGFQVAQAAWQVGYQHPRNFSVAFQRYFGRPASAITGRRKQD
ncbi:AraC family transcriptional regulator [Pantoea rodasii]|uniref:AraC family transcriptional regulator n=1 Tax=Pantoea rodasii TaxID=1076549 RepID=A0A2M9W679_9GAMM|nr:AraC family transcriptional regulator [Pantoea rodasii]ORM65263.1 AraC family transcriptional regulator [Pantoea rodasii]PJZ03042.1 AraC family transcriptional regulator [Pantoea rodasii]